MESRRERLRKAAARHRARDFSSEPGLPPTPAENRSNRKFFYVAAGALLLALVAFVCGVQMGKALSDLRWSESGGARLQDRRGDAPPFRFMEKGKDPQPAQETRVRPPEAGETRKEPSAPRQVEKAPPEKTGDSSKEPPPSGSEEGKGALAKAKYTLQVAAFNNPQEAQDLVNQLKKRGYDAYQVTGSAAAKGTLHRVRIGYFQTLQEAKQFALAFEKKENLKPIISNLPNP
jgi:cell division septation protein DedD